MPSLPEPTDASAFCTLTCDHVVEMAICERTYSVKSKFFYILMTGWCFRREFFFYLDDCTQPVPRGREAQFSRRKDPDASRIN